MTNSRLVGAVCACLLFIFAGASSAAKITYSVSYISGDTWQYDYTVINDTLGYNLENFFIYFDFAKYENLLLTDAPAGWNVSVHEPLPLFSANGNIESFGFGGGITDGESQGGFSVQFDYMAAGTPGSQPFEVVAAIDQELLQSGVTTVVPAPAALWLFGSGLLGLIGVARRKKL